MKIDLAATLSRIFAMLDNLGAANGPSDLTDSKLEQNLLMTISRHQNAMDWLVDQHATGKVRPRTRKVLRWALAEIVFLSGVPAPHVVDAATSFVKRRHSPQEAGFVNACLRAICVDLDKKDHFFDDAPRHIQLRLPEILWSRWQEQFGNETAERIANALLAPADTFLRLREYPPQQPPKDIKGVISIEPPEWAPNAKIYKLDRKARVSIADVFSSNARFYIQDPATLLAPSLLAPKPGEVVADLCAAPGGKSVLLAESLKDTGVLYAYDIAESKLARLQENLKGFSCISVAQMDATQFQSPTPLDAVLLDVPCSNTGVLRRKPDAKWTFDLKKLSELTAIQSQILHQASLALKPNGRLVYSTCSIEPDENDLQIKAFLQSHPDFTLVKKQLILPDENHDGAFAALLQKKQA
jgi:16S rRNA (cytosine967-C5)-methyltransferase